MFAGAQGSKENTQKIRRKFISENKNSKKKLMFAGAQGLIWSRLRREILQIYSKSIKIYMFAGAQGL